jgi:PAS domain S-box-containing protein
VIDLSQYVFEALRKDDEFILYRGRSKDDGSKAAFASYSAPLILAEPNVSGGDPGSAGPSRVLVVSPVTEYPAPEILRWQEHAYCLREELDPTWAARPMAIARHWDRTVLVLEDPGGEPLDQLLGQPLERSHARAPLGDLGILLRLAIGLCRAVGQLHQSGIIHKDIKPGNVLANSVTGQCWLRGFGIASRLPRERQSPNPPEFIAGTLAYMAPEQTGRMNRSIDSRSDLYSLGITLYEMLTGSLPFTASDPMEWVHCHIARQPVSPSERLKELPATISAIIMKLLAKTAEERYQTAAGVERDLRRCLTEWQAWRRIDEFPLSEHDTRDRLLIPEKLYGRAREIETLVGSFDRVVASGTPELALVSGYSGIGKSSVVNELHKVLVPPRGLFASGKFDQYKRDIPYATLAQAFESLIRPLLGKSETELIAWRDALSEALGPNGQLMVDLVPELRLIIGEQLSVPALPPQDAQRRFQRVFRRFIGVFARPEHPLALFLDDLQWLDAATLDVLEDLLTQPDVQHLMLIGAYRDNEVSSAHPLVRKLEVIRQAGAKVREIILAPLTCQDLGRLVADSLHCEPERATPLARLVHDKTAGNPFFAVQFISALAEEALLTFDHGSGRWSWDLSRIQAKGYTDNVVDLIIGKLNRLPVETQKALEEFACLGNSAEVSTLSFVHGSSEEDLHADLWAAVRLEFIVRLDGSYKFVHDRVQEAAYSLIPEPLRAEAHLRIGRLLMARTPPEQGEDAIFEIVNQINRGAALITSQEERKQLAEFNLIAGTRAKAATAYASALKYLSTGAELLAGRPGPDLGPVTPDGSQITNRESSLTSEAWERWRKLTFALELNRAECEFLTGELAAAEERLTLLSSHAANAVELATVNCLLVDLYTTLDQNDRAVDVCLDYLRYLGVEWSPHPSEEEVRREYERIWSRLGSRAVEELIELPLMSAPASLATLDVLTKVLPTAYFRDANFFSLAICKLVNLSLESGNTDGSCVAYVMLGRIAGPHFGNYKAGFRFGQLGYELVEKRGLKRFQARTYMLFGIFVIPWTKHVRAGRDLMRLAFDAANKTGDLTFAAYGCNNLNTNLLAAGDPLAEVQRETENGLAFAQKARFGLVIDIITAQLGLIRTLRGLTPKFGSFDDGQFDEFRFEQRLASKPVLALPECWYWIRKLQARFFAGDFASAVDASLRGQELLWTSPSFFETAEYHFYGALAQAASCGSAAADQRQHLSSGLSAIASAAEEVRLSRTKGEHFEALTAHYRQLEIWAENCPENFENRAALVGAEIARIEGRELEAERLYEQAIRSANANGFVHNEALANELAARFYAARRFDTIAHAYLRKARYWYLLWGADGKVRQLDELYPYLRDDVLAPGPTNTIGAPVENLDLATVIKVSQAVSGEIVSEKLIDTVMRTAIQNAGAERGLLFLSRGTELRVEAEGVTGGEGIIVRLADTLADPPAAPESIINYVVRTHETVIVDDAKNPVSVDGYISPLKARSILCLPLINRAKLSGVLYLENRLTPKVFTPARTSVLKLLASQAAISLENTRLYRDLEVREAKIRRLVDANIMGILIFSFRGEIIEANEAFLRMVGYSREDVVSGHMRWTDLTPVEWHSRDEVAVAELAATGILQPFEKEYYRKDGSRVPVMIGGATFEGSNDDGVAFALDLSKQKRAEEALLKAQGELAHVARMTTLGELTASITHEINQPLAGIVTNANASLRWLAREVPDLAEARDAIHRIVRDGNRASAVIARTRALIKKAPIAKEPLEINDVIQEVLALTQNELQRHHISVRTRFANDLPSVKADRIQLQQVLLNLVVNAIQAMSTVSDGPRELQLASQTIAEIDSEGAKESGPRPPAVGPRPAHVSVTIKDSGPGLDAEHLDHLFDPFFSTKPRGLGIGLTITRSIVEAHGGRVSAKANLPRGAVFEFTLPVNAAGVQPLP